VFPVTLIGGARVRLLEERDAVEIFAVVDRERAYLREWLPWVDGTAVAGDTLAFIQTATQQFADNDGLTAGIWSDGEFAGTIGTHKIDWLNRKVEIGYWLAPRFQGRGIVTDACRALLGHCFHEWKLHRVEIHCATGNARSCAIPLRLGFRLEGVLREAQLLSGRYHDLNVYSVLANEWESSRS
jgi:ribosomal-protein-serine acetyltransferase